LKDNFIKSKKLRILEEKLNHLRQKFRDKNDFKTVEAVFDSKTLLALYKLFNDGYLDILNGVISTGKEANVYWGVTPEGQDVAVKIYRISTLDFKNFLKYIEGDPRFLSIGKKIHTRIYVWAQKEFKNLTIAKKVGAHVPTPVTVYKNILIMEFIGENGLPAPLLKDYLPKNPEKILEIVLSDIEKLYVKGHLVHADLSEYNILVHKEIPYIIDIAQGVNIQHPNALNFLVRDIRNILRFFREEAGIDVPDIADVFMKITGLNLYEFPDLCEDT